MNRNSNRGPARWAVAAVASLMCTGVWAQVSAQDGRLLASGCFQCHGTGGAKGGFDTLAGKSKADLLHELGEMRVKSARSNIMMPHARGYTPVQLSLIADYFSKQPKP